MRNTKLIRTLPTSARPPCGADPIRAPTQEASFQTQRESSTLRTVCYPMKSP